MRRFASVLIVLSFMVACSASDTPTVEPGTGTPQTNAASPQRTTIAGVDAVVRGTLAVTETTAAITLKDNYFEPNLLTAPAGTKITFTLTSAGGTLHNFSVTEQKIDSDIAAGANASVSVTVPASGSLVFFCKYHRDESGMIGALNAT